MRAIFSASSPTRSKIGDGLDDRDHEPQVARRRLAPGDDLVALLVDGDFELIDLGIVPDHGVAERGVAFDQGVEGLLDLLFDEPAHLQHARADFLEFGVVLPGNVGMNRFHSALRKFA